MLALLSENTVFSHIPLPPAQSCYGNQESPHGRRRVGRNRRARDMLNHVTVLIEGGGVLVVCQLVWRGFMFTSICSDETLVNIGIKRKIFCYLSHSKIIAKVEVAGM